MPGDQRIPIPTHKVYGITNIKTYVPLILDLPTINYEPWSALFKAHCIAYEVLDHIDDTYDPPNQPPMDSKWLELDSMVTLWLFGSISKSSSHFLTQKNPTLEKYGSIFTLFCMKIEKPLLCKRDRAHKHLNM